MLAAERFNAAEVVYSQVGSSYSGVELLHEAVERYLKGYLLAKGWTLRKLHDLAFLNDEATKFDARFRAFDDLCENLTEQFWAQHYPGGDLTEVGSDYDELRQQAGELIALILASAPPDKRD